MSKWISIHKQLPADGDWISGMSNTGCWEERWDSNEPIGKMTHWRPNPKTVSVPLPSPSPYRLADEGWIDNTLEKRK